MAKQPAAAWVKPAALGGILILVIMLSGSRFGSVPPPGKFFNPWCGFWRNAEAGGIKGGELRLDGLRDPVSVAFDDRGVPHIFAQNEHDLYYAQGYITARDRLWQMEIQTHAAAGRLAEFLGADYLERDRFQRRLGIPRAAEAAADLMKKNGESGEAAEAYADGVNAFIASLDPSRYPLEYKLLGHAPERWSPVKTALLIKHMQWTLSGHGDDLAMSNTLGKFGAGFMENFHPDRDSTLEPVIPAGTDWAPRRDTGSAPMPPAAGLMLPGVAAPLLPGDTSRWPDPAGGSRAVAGSGGTAAGRDSIGPSARDTSRSTGDSAPLQVPPAKPTPGNGSNNFVVSGRRTTTGYPILANDPHLDLGLPSIWYEAQLAAPGVNYYGATLAGSPGAVIGFNRNIAWGLTNGNDDVFDWYRIEFRDSTLAEYLFAGNWRATSQVVEAIRIKGGRTVLDTVRYTHHGPLVLKAQEKPRGRNLPAMHALRWLALDPSDELLAFLRIARAQSYGEFHGALSSFQCPSQNFAFASAAGDIAMEHHGRYPRKWKGQGRYTLVGSEPGHDWQGWIPRAENPRAVNPGQGWLASANQDPVDPSYPHYLGSGWFQGRRPARLAQLVAEADTLSPVGAATILMDDLNLHAAEILPELLRRLNTAGLSPADSAAHAALMAWDFRHRSDSASPALFDRWWRSLYRQIWQDEFSGDTLHYQWPGKDRTRRLILEEPGEDWFDDITTPSRETLNLLVNRTFRDAAARHRAMPGRPTWAAYRPVDIRHLARIPALGRLAIPADGCADCVNSLKTSHGPSLRMVVALGRPAPKAWGIYPGGQSGNPGSPRYDDFVEVWARGEFHELLFLSDLGDRPDRTPVRLLLEGK